LYNPAPYGKPIKLKSSLIDNATKQTLWTTAADLTGGFTPSEDDEADECMSQNEESSSTEEGEDNDDEAAGEGVGGDEQAYNE
jgi:hypothetical protein